MSSNASSPPCEAEGKTLPLSMSSPVIIRQFLSKDDHISRRHLLRITATQLMDYLISMAGDTIPESIIRFLNVTNDDSSKLEDLIRAILQELPLTYIFVDGLDEAEYAIIPKSTLTFRPPEDVQLFIEFLIQETAQSSDKVRLWLTSQPLPSIRQYVCNPENPEWCGRIGQIQLTTDDTQSDIESYLSHYIPISTKNKSSLAKFIVSKSLKTEVEGSFLWASAMVNEFQDETEDDDDVMALAEKSLPVKMSKVYEKVLNKIVDNDKKPKSPPLWK
jgi:hypothetical protein